MSREGSFLGQNRHKASARGGNYDESEIDQQLESDGSDSSYDSTNAFNVYQHSLRFKQKNEKASLAREALQAFIKAQQDPNFGASEREDEEKEKEFMRSMARQINVKVNNLHIRYEDDYFSGGQPYTMGWVLKSFQISQPQVGNELWQFQEFLGAAFKRVSARTDSPGNMGATIKDDQVVFKELTATGCRFYVNSRSQVYIPMSLWELKQNLPNTIFEDLPPDLIMSLMQETSMLNYIMEPIDIQMSIGDINSQQFFMNLVTGVVSLKLSPSTVSSLNKLVEYQENYKITLDLKMYRPQRRPCS